MGLDDKMGMPGWVMECFCLILFCFMYVWWGVTFKDLRYGYQGQFVVTNKLIKLFYVMLFLKMQFEAVYTVVS